MNRVGSQRHRKKNVVVKRFLNYFKLSRFVKPVVIDATENAIKLSVKQLAYVGGRLVRRYGWKCFGWVEVLIPQPIQR